MSIKNKYLSVSELKKGVVYTNSNILNNNDRQIWKFNEIREIRETPTTTIWFSTNGKISIDRKIFLKGGGFSNNNYEKNIELASKEDTLWLERCVKADKYVDKGFTFRKNNWYKFKWDFVDDIKWIIGKCDYNHNDILSVNWNCRKDINNNITYHKVDVFYIKDMSNITELTSEEAQEYFPKEYNDKQKDKELPFKIGDKVTILSKPDSWSSSFGGKYGIKEVVYPYTFTVKNIKRNTGNSGISIFDGKYGWNYDEKLFKKVTKKDNNINKEDLTGRFVRVTEKLADLEHIYNIKPGDILKITKWTFGVSIDDYHSLINKGHYHGMNCINDGRLELLPKDYSDKENINNLSVKDDEYPPINSDYYKDKSDKTITVLKEFKPVILKINK